MMARVGALGIVLAACSTATVERRGPIAWQPAIEVATGGGEKGPWQQNNSRYDYVDDPSVALDPDGGAAVVWVDQARKEVLLQRYDRRGAPRWSDPIRVSRSPDVFSWLPRIVLSPTQPEDVFVLWQEIVFSGGSHGGETFFARSLDGGATFDTPLNLSRSVAGDGKARLDKDSWHNGSLDLAIAPSGDIHVAWTEYDGPLWVSRSADRGATFTPPLRIATGTTAPARAPTLAIGTDGSVHLAWTIGEDPRADLRLARSTDGGASFGAPAIVAVTPGYSDAPKLAVDAAGTLHLVHGEHAGGPRGPAAIHYQRSRDGGVTWESSRVLSRPTPSAAFPSLIAGTDGQVCVSWELIPAGAELPRGLGITCSRDGGSTFFAATDVAHGRDPAGGWNGSQQGRLMRKLALRDGALAIVNSSLEHGDRSRVWLIRGVLVGSR